MCGQNEDGVWWSFGCCFCQVSHRGKGFLTAGKCSSAVGASSSPGSVESVVARRTATGASLQQPREHSFKQAKKSVPGPASSSHQRRSPFSNLSMNPARGEMSTPDSCLHWQSLGSNFEITINKAVNQVRQLSGATTAKGEGFAMDGDASTLQQVATAVRRGRRRGGGVEVGAVADAAEVSQASLTFAAVCQRLVRLLAGTMDTPEIAVPAGDPAHSVGKAAIREDLATLCGIAVWATQPQVVVPPEQITAVVDLLSAAIARALVCIISPGIEKASYYDDRSVIPASAARDVGEELADIHAHVWDTANSARQGVVREALACRYGSAKSAPSVAAVSGAPLVLVVREKLQAVQIEDPRHTVLNNGVDDERNVEFRDWEHACLGIALVQKIEIEREDHVRPTLSAAMKEAVQTSNLAPLLVVLPAHKDSTLASACEVMRAVCDTYSARLHVEGEALVLLAQDVIPPPRQVSLCRRFAHTILIDPAAWLGLGNAAIVTLHLGMRDADHSAMSETAMSASLDLTLTKVIALWTVLQRVGLSKIRNMVRNVTNVATQLNDILLLAPPTIETRVVGSGALTLFSYVDFSPSQGQPVSVRDINAALLAKIKIRSRNESVEDFKRRESLDLIPVRYANRDWIGYCPLMCLETGAQSSTSKTPESCLKALSTALVQAVRTFEIAGMGREHFRRGVSKIIAESSDGADNRLELVEPVECGPHAKMVFGAVRCIPTGVRGQWWDDPQAVIQVNALTAGLGGALKEIHDLEQSSSETETDPSVRISFECEVYNPGFAVEGDVEKEAEALKASVLCIFPLCGREASEEESQLAAETAVAGLQSAQADAGSHRLQQELEKKAAVEANYATRLSTTSGTDGKKKKRRRRPGASRQIEDAGETVSPPTPAGENGFVPTLTMAAMNASNESGGREGEQGPNGVISENGDEAPVGSKETANGDAARRGFLSRLLHKLVAEESGEEGAATEETEPVEDFFRP